MVEKQPADVVCSEIKLCNSSAVPAKVVPPPAPIAGLKNGTLECDMCQVCRGKGRTEGTRGRREAMVEVGRSIADCLYICSF